MDENYAFPIFCLADNIFDPILPNLILMRRHPDSTKTVVFDGPLLAAAINALPGNDNFRTQLKTLQSIKQNANRHKRAETTVFKDENKYAVLQEVLKRIPKARVDQVNTTTAFLVAAFDLMDALLRTKNAYTASTAAKCLLTMFDFENPATSTKFVHIFRSTLGVIIDVMMFSTNPIGAITWAWEYEQSTRWSQPKTYPAFICNELVKDFSYDNPAEPLSIWCGEFPSIPTIQIPAITSQLSDDQVKDVRKICDKARTHSDRKKEDRKWKRAALVADMKEFAMVLPQVPWSPTL